MIKSDHVMASKRDECVCDQCTGALGPGPGQTNRLQPLSHYHKRLLIHLIFARLLFLLQAGFIHTSHPAVSVLATRTFPECTAVSLSLTHTH